VGKNRKPVTAHRHICKRWPHKLECLGDGVVSNVKAFHEALRFGQKHRN
jgi:hypothetical protein